MEFKKTKFNNIRKEAKEHDFVKPFSKNDNIYNLRHDGKNKGIIIYTEKADDFVKIELLFIYKEYRNSSIGSDAYDKIMKMYKIGKALLYSDIARNALIKRGWKVSNSNDNLLYYAAR